LKNGLAGACEAVFFDVDVRVKIHYEQFVECNFAKQKNEKKLN